MSGSTNDFEDMKKPLLFDEPPNPESNMSDVPNPESQDDSRVITAFTEIFPEDVVHNIIITSRYTLLNFFPRSLFEQFRRLANVYFLVLGIIAAVGQYTNYFETSVEAAGILAPMVTVVLISVIKDGVEDVKRHQADALVNAKIAHIVTSSDDVSETEWQDLLPGNVILLLNGDELPADVVVLACGGIQGPTCYVETAAIDGETNLKPRLPCLVAEKQSGGTLKADSSIEVSADWKKVTGVVPMGIVTRVEKPSEVIDEFNGSVSFTDGSGATHRSALTKSNLLLRGSIIRASEWCVGMVVYTGKETKLSMNSKRAPSKLSSVDRVVNRTLIIAMSTMLFVCVLSMMLGIFWGRSNENATYLCLDSNDIAFSGAGSQGQCNSGSADSVLTIFTFATLYNNFVCISMYVSLEMVYLCQSYFICHDLTMYDETTDTPAECHSSGMCADLGQVQYVLSDKTGTLTKNIMRLRRVSVAGLIYGAPIPIPTDPAVSFPRDSILRASDSSISSHTQSKKAASRRSFGNGIGGGDLGDIWEPLDHLSRHATAWGESGSGPKMSNGPGAPNRATSNSDSSPGDVVSDFARVLVACNTVIIMPDMHGEVDIRDMSGLTKHLQAESPDEVALVFAAGEHAGLLLRKREGSRVFIRKSVVRGGEGSHAMDVESYADEELEVLAVNGFDSDRKRMSVLVRLSSGELRLLVKGADTSLLPLCREGAYTEDCLGHIELFASSGLRTLVMGQRTVSEEEGTAWLADYKTAANSIGKRTELLSRCAIAIERDFDLLGAVGIEDELQDGVPEAISTLLEAGLNVWMITGDKAETAIAISRLCSLLTDDHEVEKVLSLSGEALRQRILDLHGYVEGRHSVTLGSGSSPSGTYSLSIDQMKRGGGETNSSNSNSINGSVLSAGLEEVQGVQRNIGKNDPKKKIALIVDGLSLEALWALPDLKARFTAAVRSVPTVIACRVSPKQKAALVRMVKTGAGNPITLAIGDGANDVGMIHEARVGVGITGKEGRHAANSSDFAIGQFRFIVPLMLEHGRYNYIRCSKLVLYSFFKNLLLVSILFYYCIYSGFSGTIPLDSIVFSGYNFYLGLPIVCLGALDFDVPRECIQRYPFLSYATGRRGELLNLSNMGRWCFFAFLQGMLLFVMTIRFFGGIVSLGGNFKVNISGPGMNNQEGQGTGIFVEGFTLYCCAVIAMQYKVMMMTNSRTILNWVLWLLSFGGFFCFTFLYGIFPTLDWYDVMPTAFSLDTFWQVIFLVPIVLALSDIVFEQLGNLMKPSSQQQLLAILEEEKRQAIEKAAKTTAKNAESEDSGLASRIGRSLSAVVSTLLDTSDVTLAQADGVNKSIDNTNATPRSSSMSTRKDVPVYAPRNSRNSGAGPKRGSESINEVAGEEVTSPVVTGGSSSSISSITASPSVKPARTTSTASSTRNSEGAIDIGIAPQRGGSFGSPSHDGHDPVRM